MSSILNTLSGVGKLILLIRVFVKLEIGSHLYLQAGH